MTTATTGVELIRTERIRQATEKGWTPEHDDTHVESELARAGAAYALATYDPGSEFTWALCEDLWPFEDGEGCSWSPNYRTPGPAPEGQTVAQYGRDLKVRDLVRAGALIAAEIDRILRLS